MDAAEFKIKKALAIKELQFRLDNVEPGGLKHPTLAWIATVTIFTVLALGAFIKAAFGVVFRWVRMAIHAVCLPFIAIYYTIDLLIVAWWYFVKMTRKLLGEEEK